VGKGDGVVELGRIGWAIGWRGINRWNNGRVRWIETMRGLVIMGSIDRGNIGCIDGVVSSLVNHCYQFVVWSCIFTTEGTRGSTT
jgi:hypothetical protein